jgi:hypothetical protein
MKCMDQYQAITIAEFTFPLRCFGFNQRRANYLLFQHRKFNALILNR